MIKCREATKNLLGTSLGSQNSKFSYTKKTLPCLCLKAYCEQSMNPNDVLEIGVGSQLTKPLETNKKFQKKLF